MISRVLPNWVDVRELLYVNSVVNAWGAFDKRTSKVLIVLRTQHAMQQCLEMAEKSILNLRDQAGAPIIGLPLIYASGLDVSRTAYLVLGDFLGSRASDRLRSLFNQDHASEQFSPEDILRIAHHHLVILNGMHRQKLTGFRPTVHDVWYDRQRTEYSLRFLGWEWITQHLADLENEDIQGDLVAAASLWFELLAGFPPAAELQVNDGAREWLASPRSLRSLIVDIWRGSHVMTVDDAIERIRSIRTMLVLEPADLLQHGKRLIEKDPGMAISYLELAQDRSSELPEVDYIIAAAYAQAGRPVETLITQTRQLLHLGRYQQAMDTIRRVDGVPGIEASRQLAAARWNAVAHVLHDAVELNVMAVGVAVHDTIAPILIHAVECIEGEDLISADDLLSSVAQELPVRMTGRIKSLTDLQNEVRTRQLVAKAKVHTRNGEHSLAVSNFKEAVAALAGLSYREALVKEIGSVADAFKDAQSALKDQTRYQEQYEQIEQAAKKQEFRRAAKSARELVGLTNDRARKGRLLNYAHLMEACAAIQECAALYEQVKNGVVEAENARVGLDAIKNLLDLHPISKFGKEQFNRWQALLLSLAKGQRDLPQKLQAAALLWTYRHSDAESEQVEQVCREVAADALKQWEAARKEIATQTAEKRHLKSLTELQTKIRAQIADIEDHQWVNDTVGGPSFVELSSALTEAQRTVDSKLRRIIELRNEYEHLLNAGALAADPVSKARQEGIELYDDPAMAINSLPTGMPTGSENVFTMFLQIGCLALLQGNSQLAHQIFALVGDLGEVPDRFARMAEIGTAAATAAPLDLSTFNTLAAELWRQQAQLQVNFRRLIEEVKESNAKLHNILQSDQTTQPTG